ncbi:hypothetical protein QJQ45_020328, partial [Haematococcus lacustris]
ADIDTASTRESRRTWRPADRQRVSHSRDFSNWDETRRRESSLRSGAFNTSDPWDPRHQKEEGRDDRQQGGGRGGQGSRGGRGGRGGSRAPDPDAPVVVQRGLGGAARAADAQRRSHASSSWQGAGPPPSTVRAPYKKWEEEEEEEDREAEARAGRGSRAAGRDAEGGRSQAVARQGNTRRSLGFDPFEGDSGDRRQAAVEEVRGKEEAAAAAKEELGGPAQPPPVRMRMDLPVKAEGGTAKGSFFAATAYAADSVAVVADAATDAAVAADATNADVATDADADADAAAAADAADAHVASAALLCCCPGCMDWLLPLLVCCPAAIAEDAYWDGLGLLPDIVAALKQLGFKRPSHIQLSMLATPHVCAACDAANAWQAGALKAWRSAEAQHLALADQAGSGKTLAYLLPLFQALKAEDMLRGSPATQAGSPRAVVLLPTVELVQQVYRVAKALSKAGAKLRVAAMTGGQDSEAQRYKSLRTQRDTLAAGVDLVVATPGRLAEHMRHRSLDFSCCKAIVLDEVDVLLVVIAAFAAAAVDSLPSHVGSHGRYCI